MILDGGLNVLTLFPYDLGVYAWIGINFVLGRFNHVETGQYVVKPLLSSQLLINAQRESSLTLISQR